MGIMDNNDYEKFEKIVEGNWDKIQSVVREAYKQAATREDNAYTHVLLDNESDEPYIVYDFGNNSYPGAHVLVSYEGWAADFITEEEFEEGGYDLYPDCDLAFIMGKKQYLASENTRMANDRQERYNGR
ncbi:hypothetical protein FACS1894187_14930 [Synergistales bacterium]|nr:hypothetical protein FACS1894187_14930 [Synergistales bacterium]